MAVYLVTGGAGFIGSCLSNKLIKLGNEVIIIDNLSTGYMENIPSEATFINGDVFDINAINLLPTKKYDAIFHIAGQSSGEISFEDPAYDIRTNAESTLHLIKWGLENNISRFIYASTMSVYGKVTSDQVNEEFPTEPLSFYGVGKVASENYIRIFNSRGLKGTCLRLFNVYGPGQNLKNMKQGMVSIFMAYILQNKEIHVKGDSRRFRDFIYIDDVVNAFIECLNNDNTIGKIFNIGTGVKTMIKELVESLITVSGSKAEEYPHRYEGSTPGDQFGIYSNISKVKKETNWKPKISLSEGLKIMWDWAKERN